MEGHFQPPSMRSTSWTQHNLNQVFYDSQNYILYTSAVEHITSLTYNLTDLRPNIKWKDIFNCPSCGPPRGRKIF